MHSSKLFSCVSFSAFCFSTIASTNSVFAENFKYEKNFLESFLNDTKKFKDLDENKLEKSKDVFLSSLFTFDRKFQLLKDRKRFYAFIDNLDAVVNGRLRAMTCLESLLKIFKNDLDLLKKFLRNTKLKSNGNVSNFASEVVNKVDEFVYSSEAKSNEKSVDLHNLLGGMYGETQKIAFFDQLMNVYKSIIGIQIGNKEISVFTENNFSELKLMIDILKVDKASLFAICKFYNRLKNKTSFKEELKIDEFVKYLEDDEKKNLRNNEPISYSAYLAGLAKKLLLYPIVDGYVIKFIDENKKYPLDSDFFKILVNIFKKSLQLDDIGKDNRNKQFIKKKRKLFRVVFPKNEEKGKKDTIKVGDDKNLVKRRRIPFRVVYPKNQEKENFNNGNLVEAKIDPFRTSNSEYKKENSANQPVDCNKNSTKEKHDLYGKNLKDEIKKISDGLDFVQDCLNFLFSSEKPHQEDI